MFPTESSRAIVPVLVIVPVKSIFPLPETDIVPALVTLFPLITNLLPLGMVRVVPLAIVASDDRVTVIFDSKVESTSTSYFVRFAELSLSLNTKAYPLSSLPGILVIVARVLDLTVIDSGDFIYSSPGFVELTCTKNLVPPLSGSHDVTVLLSTSTVFTPDVATVLAKSLNVHPVTISSVESPYP